MEHGDCNVPEHWAEDPPLGNLVHKQRTLKKQLDRGKPGVGMTVERVARMTALGFAWGANEDVWDAQLAWLTVYKVVHGDCNSPKGWAKDPPLGNWVNRQRTLKNKLDLGEPGKEMTVEWVAWLTALGFV